MYQRIKPYGNSAIIIEWENEISTETLKEITYYTHIIRSEAKAWILEVIPAYASLTIVYLPELISYDHAVNWIENLGNDQDKHAFSSPEKWVIPTVYYPSEHPDMSYISAKTGLNLKEIISLHSGVEYDVFFIGFLPGFMYLGGLDIRLHLPRKITPNLNVKAGSVAIGGAQTGVYPQDSPGGWYVIGHTDFNFFDSSRPPYCQIKAGDKVRFEPI
jgi:inhibitor of KinA